MTSYLNERIERINQLMEQTDLEQDSVMVMTHLLDLISRPNTDSEYIRAYWSAIRSFGRQIWPDDRVWLKSFKT